MALAAAACFAVYLLATERVRAHTSTLEFLRLAILFSTIFMFAFTLILRVSLGIPDRRTFLPLLGLGLVSQLGGYLALTYALGHLPATVTSVSLLSQGPLTAVLAALLLGEPLSVIRSQAVHSFWWVLAWRIGWAGRKKRQTPDSVSARARRLLRETIAASWRLR